jgi:L-serine dehydratase
MLRSLREIVDKSENENISFWKVVQMDDCNERAVTEEDSYKMMLYMYRSMKEADNNYDAKLKSSSGLVGGEGEKVRKRRLSGKMLSGDLMGRVMERALKTGESNACMKRIVAAPTAGSCGVVPSVFITIQEELNLSDDKMVEAMYVAAGIGSVIADRASISGAEGGCQAEIGSASAMAAGGAAYLLGGTSADIANAAALALKGLLGLACDPVAGLVEVPCVKRNVLGAINAVSCADMTIAGISTKIPPDEVIDAMRSIGRNMNSDIRETGIGGLAGTPTGVSIRNKIKM